MSVAKEACLDLFLGGQPVLLLVSRRESACRGLVVRGFLDQAKDLGIGQSGPAGRLFRRAHCARNIARAISSVKPLSETRIKGGGAMDATRFEARLRAEGFPEIRTNAMPPHCHNAEHSHPFDVL